MEPLKLEDITMLLGEVPKHLKDRVEAKVKESLDILKEKGYGAHPPEIKYDLKGHTAGMASADYIRVNAQILINPEFTEDMINNTIPHEIAHVVVRQTWPSAKGHGNEWKRMMYYLGLPAERCHSYDTVAARKRERAARPHVYYCKCDRPHMVTNILHRRIQQGRQYTCRTCGSYLTEG